MVVWLRRARPLHRWVGVALAAIVLLSSTTGILLGWKKHSALLQPSLHQGASLKASDWVSLERITSAAEAGLRAQLQGPPGPIDRVDVRPSHGVAKVLFKKGFWEVQVDLTTAQVLSVSRRTSDIIEAFHDGSFFGESARVAQSSFLGLGLVLLSLSGLWLWWGPRWVRHRRASSSH